MHCQGATRQAMSQKAIERSPGKTPAFGWDFPFLRRFT